MGLELDEPLGKNDGELKGVRYFNCSKDHGLLVRPSVLTPCGPDPSPPIPPPPVGPDREPRPADGAEVLVC